MKTGLTGEKTIMINLLPRKVFGLSFADSEYFCAAARALTLGGRTLVLHCDCFGVLDFNLFPTLDTICLHFYLLISEEIDLEEEVIT